MKVWIHVDGVQEGPFELDQLPLDRITPDTPVWYDGLPQWIRAGDAPAVAELMAEVKSQEPAAEVKSQEPAAEVKSQKSKVKSDEPQGGDIYQPRVERSATLGGATMGGAEAYKVPTAYLVWGIITTLLCCTPLSIAALFTWGTARSKCSYGDIPGAKKWANATAWLLMISIVLALAALPFMLIFNSI